MTLLIISGVSVFVALMLCFLLLMSRSSAQGALLEQVTREARSTGPVSGPWKPSVSGDLIAKPFTAFRRFFAAEPDPEIVRRLLLAGYRKPHHADMFLGARLAVPAVLGLTAAMVFSGGIITFVFALVIGF